MKPIRNAVNGFGIFGLMRKWLMLALVLAAQQTHALEAYYTATVFKGIEASYVEVYIGIETNSIKWMERDSIWRGGCEVRILVKDGSVIISADKFDLVTKEFDQPPIVGFTLLGLRRIELNPGDYILTVELADLADSTNRQSLSPTVIEATGFDSEVSISGIQFMESVSIATKEGDWFWKNGFHFKPQLYAFYPTDQPTMNFYGEVYGLDVRYAREDFLLMYSVRKKGWQEPVEGFVTLARQKGDVVNMAMSLFDLRELPSGSYELVIEVRTRENDLLASRSAGFIRSNKLSVNDLATIKLLDVEETFVATYTAEDMPFYLKSVKPRATLIEQRAIDDLLATADAELMRKFLYNFWVARNALAPAKAWGDYLEMVTYVNGKYNTMNHYGFETDRGRVYLQYGPPNDVHESHFEGGTKPYEIWQYNVIPNNETNVVFVFFNDDLVSNDYRLIHSTATGEVYNEHWKLLLNENFNYEEIKDFDNTAPRDRVGSQTYDIIPE